MTVVLDTSAILALLFDEPGRERVASVLDEASVSAVNLAEIVTKLIDVGYADEDMEQAVEAFLPFVAPFDVPLAIAAGAMRRGTRQHGLSLGDRACLALAQRDSAQALTADRAWSQLDIGVAVDVIR